MNKRLSSGGFLLAYWFCYLILFSLRILNRRFGKPVVQLSDAVTKAETK